LKTIKLTVPISAAHPRAHPTWLTVAILKLAMIAMKFSRRTQNGRPMLLMVNIQVSTSNISAVDSDIVSKYGLQIKFDLLKPAPSSNAQPEVHLQRTGRHLKIWTWRQHCGVMVVQCTGLSNNLAAARSH